LTMMVRLGKVAATGSALALSVAIVWATVAPRFISLNLDECRTQQTTGVVVGIGAGLAAVGLGLRVTAGVLLGSRRGWLALLIGVQAFVYVVVGWWEFAEYGSFCGLTF